ncbi:hypothetical protein [Ensifer sp. 22564]|uniref:hypothetical protein n=1 Tax=unclassified Ensifer TaxID=2633371 RepID=UPI003F87568D
MQGQPTARPHGRDGGVLPDKFARERIDLRLTLGGQRRQVRPVAFEESSWLWRLASTVARVTPAKQRKERGHSARDLAIDQFQLMLRLPPRRFHAGEL